MTKSSDGQSVFVPLHDSNSAFLLSLFWERYIYVVCLCPCLSITRSGNFIIGASVSDKQMLCASSGARAALNIAAEKNKTKDVGQSLIERICFCGVVFLKKENYMLLSSLLQFPHLIDTL